MTSTRTTSREAMVKRARRWLRDYELDVNTEASWNENVRKPGEPVLDAYDPDGTLAKYAKAIREMLASEDERLLGFGGDDV